MNPYRPRPGDITLPPTTSIDLTHLVATALAVADPVTAAGGEAERAA